MRSGFSPCSRRATGRNGPRARKLRTLNSNVSALPSAGIGATLTRRHADLQRARDELEPRRGRPDRLAVELDRERLGGVDLDRGAAQRLDLRVGEILAAVE